LIIAAPFSAIMIVGALVLVEVTAGHHRSVDDPEPVEPVEPVHAQPLVDDPIACFPIMQVQPA
jgi:hypothetical protein